MYSDLELATEIVRRIEEHDSIEFAVPFDPAVHGADTNVTPLRPNVPALEEDEELGAVARPAETEPTDEQ